MPRTAKDAAADLDRLLRKLELAWVAGARKLGGDSSTGALTARTFASASPSASPDRRSRGVRGGGFAV